MNRLAADYDILAGEYAARYSHELEHKPFDRQMLDRLRTLAAPIGVICDLGCGPGQIARYLKDGGAMAPVEAREVNSRGGETEVEPSAPDWTWVLTWQAASRAALEEAWPEYHRRLAAAHPGRPGPDTFCTRVRIENSNVLRHRQRVGPS